MRFGLWYHPKNTPGCFCALLPYSMNNIKILHALAKLLLCTEYGSATGPVQHSALQSTCCKFISLERNPIFLLLVCTTWKGKSWGLVLVLVYSVMIYAFCIDRLVKVECTAILGSLAAWPLGPPRIGNGVQVGGKFPNPASWQLNKTS
jgi:hypothetical protein